MKITLYLTDSCTLCDEAVNMIVNSRSLQGNILETIDVVSDENLLEKYGESIPVVRIGTATKAWPFSAEDIFALLQAKESS